jgi:hypothetical protein
MKAQVISCLITLLLGFFLNADNSREHKKWSDYYKTGKLTVNEKLKLGDHSLPESEHIREIASFVETKSGTIFLSDTTMNKLYVFDSKGRFVKTVGQKGNGPGDLYFPSFLLWHEDCVVVYEFGNRRLSYFNENGEYIKSKKMTAAGMIKKIRVLPCDNLLIENLHFSQKPNTPQICGIFLCSRDIKPIKKIYSHQISPYNMILKPQKMHLLNPYAPVVSWDITPNGNIVVGFQGKYELDIIDPTKRNLHKITHSIPPVKVSDNDKEIFFSKLRYGDTTSSKKGANDFVRHKTEFPEFLPPYKDVICDSDGNILVFPYVTQKAKENNYFDWFSPDGKYKGRVKIISKSIFVDNPKLVFKQGYFWSLIISDEGERSLAKFVINK